MKSLTYTIQHSTCQDFHARQLDSNLGCFTSIDPMSEKYYGTSPYAYCAGDPVDCIDPTGKFINAVTALAGACLAGATVTQTAIVSGVANATGTVVEKSVTRGLSGEQIIQKENISNDCKDVIASTAIGTVVGAGSKGLQSLSNEAKSLIKNESANLSKLEESSVNRFLPKGNNSNLATRTAAAQSTKQMAINNAKYDLKAINAVGAASFALDKILNVSGTTIIGTAYEERKNK